MNILTCSIKQDKEYNEILKTIDEQTREKPHPLLVTGLCEGARLAYYVSTIKDLKERYGHGVLIVVQDEKEALKLSNSFRECGLNAYIYPLRDFIFYNITASHEYEHERLSVLSAIISNSYDAIITTPDAALQYTIPKYMLSENILKIDRNEKYHLQTLIDKLYGSGYVKVEMVDGVGQYSVRGGILDIFPPFNEYPVRIEFFDDEIDQMGIFDIMTQRRIENIDNFQITSAREVLISEEKKLELKKLLLAQVKKATDERVKNMLYSEIESIDGGTELYYIDKYISFIYPEKSCMLDYFDKTSIYIIQEYNGIKERLKTFEWHMQQTITGLLEEESIISKYANYNKWQDDFDYFVDNKIGIIINTFATGVEGKKLSGIFSFITKQTVSYSDNFDLLKEDLDNYIKNGYHVALLCENEITAKNLCNSLNENGIQTILNKEENLPIGVPVVFYGKNIYGYELTLSKFTCLSLYVNPNSYSHTILSRNKKSNKKKSSQEKIMSYADLEIGDFIVHLNHGIGQYLGIQNLTIDNVSKDYIKIQYSGKDMLYLPCNQLDLISKYIGSKSDDGSVKLSKMGSPEWGKAKAKVKAAAKNMAKELIKLYAERLRKKGYAFAPDEEFQRDFDAAFEYEETDGQINAIDEIKVDMEQPYPMDRLLCGDVGFGKTEVALRAAFKAIIDGKQVALLVPTTILAFQHYQTILTRMRGFPVKAELLSRFRTQKQQDETLRRLRRGDVDIVVGTHRLVSNDITFKDLGLVIIDEEQRFGVAHKEKLKQIAGNVDVLTLTATPIPRTLNMAMSGIRDMSVLDEAPGDRLPVQTYVLEHDDLIVAEALKKELRRGGQVFYLHNNIETIESTANKILAMVPEASVAVAHGRMEKEELSNIWRSLVMGETDILVCTTIIETGVDVPNANTLIIENSDKLGLSQLHQIRGRVGRSSRRAYSYFTYPKGRVLTEIATRRLSAIREYTEFGSGFKIALRDLEIRGAGNILGSEQHGHMDSVGYDLYIKILNEAILEEKGEAKIPKLECLVDLAYDAFIPEKYIYTSTQRIDAYKKIASIENDVDLDDIADELLDRYGDIPKSVDNLFRISLIRSLGSECRIIKVSQKNNIISIYPEKIDILIWTELATIHKGRILMSLGEKPYISLKIQKGDFPLIFLCELFKEYIQLKNKKQ